MSPRLVPASEPRLLLIAWERECAEDDTGYFLQPSEPANSTGIAPEIWINRGLEERERLLTWLHEIGHFLLGYDGSHPIGDTDHGLLEDWAEQCLSLLHLLFPDGRHRVPAPVLT